MPSYKQFNKQRELIDSHQSLKLNEGAVEGRTNTNWWNKIRTNIKHLGDHYGITVSFKYIEDKICLEIYGLEKEY